MIRLVIGVNTGTTDAYAKSNDIPIEIPIPTDVRVKLFMKLCQNEAVVNILNTRSIISIGPGIRLFPKSCQTPRPIKLSTTSIVHRSALLTTENGLIYLVKFTSLA
jgi:hypothetical protein